MEAKINGVVFRCIPEEHLHQSQRSLKSVCMCVWLYMQTHVCLTQERLRAQKNFLIINSQFLHLFSACVCACVCPFCDVSSGYEMLLLSDLLPVFSLRQPIFP